MRRKREWIIYISIAMVIVLLNVIAWNSTAFCDAYIAYIFPIWVNTYGRLMGCFPFSVGEWLLVAGVMLVIGALLLGVLRTGIGLYKLAGKVRKATKADTGLCKKYSLEKKIAGFYHFFAWVLLIICLVMTLNCFLLYHASTFSQKYFRETTQDYKIEDVIRLYNHVASNCNDLSEKMKRDDKGMILYNGVNRNGAPVDMEDKAIEVMQQLGKTYPQLDGYYPRPKPMMFSDFMCQQYMCGYYFPFSMEANYNDVMYIMNKPSSMCHELAHLRGFIYEDEANFISYLACVESDDITFQYAGYLSVLNYIMNDLYQAKQTTPKEYEAALQYVQPVSLLPVVQEDNVFVLQEEWDRINGKAILDTETVDEVSEAFTDTTLKINGVSDGMMSYNRVVRLLLQYYN